MRKSELREGENELRCQGCGAWLDETDLSCGLMKFCTGCCLEPEFLHIFSAQDEESCER
jgi:hypothetical protein